MHMQLRSMAKWNFATVVVLGILFVGCSGASSEDDESLGSALTAPAPDPNADGPYAITEKDASTKVIATGDTVPIHVAYPSSGPTAGPYPVVVIAHGFQLASSQYYGYARRLATFGYVALTADYPTSLLGTPNNVHDAQDLSGALDWALGAPELAGRADGSRAGVMGHSRGGKAAVLAAARDPRFRAVFGLDPVDSKPPFGTCDAVTECPDASDAMASLAIPSLFVGETLDSTGTIFSFGAACAPGADNFTTFYGSARTPSVSVTVRGANHMSFLEAQPLCGLACLFCRPATASSANVLNLAHAYAVSFFERRLRADVRYDAWLIGTDAHTKYEVPGLATIVSK